MLLKKNPKKSKKAKPSYDELGRMLENIYESGYIDHNQAYKMSFIKGVFSGLGGVLGATIVVGFLLGALSLFNNVPLVGRLVNNIRQTVQNQRH